MTKEKEKTCFVITPIGDTGSEIRRHIDGIIDEVVIPVVTELGFKCEVAHRLFSTGQIVKQIIDKLYNSDLVIANLTTLNPNVMYELAFRHTIGKVVICIAEENVKLPFDTQSEKTIFYVNDFQGSKELKEKLKMFIEDIDYNTQIFDNPITNAIKTLDIETRLVTKSEGEDVNLSQYIVNRLDRIEQTIIKSTEPRLNIRRSSDVKKYSDDYNKICFRISGKKLTPSIRTKILEALYNTPGLDEETVKIMLALSLDALFLEIQTPVGPVNIENAIRLTREVLEREGFIIEQVHNMA